ncbi:MAG: hypothetical protein ACF8K1_06125 [Phycisphaerales bacterium JB047]
MRTEALQDHRLTAIVAAWPDLPEETRVAIERLVQDSTERGQS